MKKRIVSLLLTLVMVLSLVPMSVFAADNHDGQVHVIVENTTYPEAEGAPWEGTLVEEWIDLNEDSTMMGCVVEALEKNGCEQTGAENNYISSIEGLGEFDGGSMSGWMGTLNDWFTNQGFGAFTVADGTLGSGDEIRIMYTRNGYGADLGGSWDNHIKTVKALTFSAGELSPAFDPDTHEYTLTVDKGTDSVLVTPTASNKNYQVRTYVGETEYKRTAMVPTVDGTTITVKCGDPSWPNMNNDNEPAQVYTASVLAQLPQVTLKLPGYAADAVEKLIDAIGTVTLDSEEAIKAARGAYDALTEEQKAQVGNYQTLLDAEAKLADLKAVDAVEKLIDAIGTVTLDSEEAIKAARDAYDALTDAQKELVGNYQTLLDAEAKLADLKAADAVEKLIDAIGTVTLDSEEAIKAARDAYDALTDAQKEQVGNYQTLLGAEAKLAQLKKDAEKPSQPEQPDKPATGDAGVALWLTVMCMTTLLGAALVGKKRKA